MLEGPAVGRPAAAWRELADLEALEALRRVSLGGLGEAPIPEWAAGHFGVSAEKPRIGWTLLGVGGEWAHVRHPYCVDFAVRTEWVLDAVDAAGEDLDRGAGADAVADGAADVVP